jgi:hypothetical protein
MMTIRMVGILAQEAFYFFDDAARRGREWSLIFGRRSFEGE